MSESITAHIEVLRTRIELLHQQCTEAMETHAAARQLISQLSLENQQLRDQNARFLAQLNPRALYMDLA